MAFVWADVVAVAPELSTFPLALQPIYLQRAINAIDPAEFCGDTTPEYQLAVWYLAAHFATEKNNANANAGNPGAVKSESVGGLSVSYGEFGTETTRANFSSTSYGAIFDALLMQSPCRVRFAINVV